MDWWCFTDENNLKNHFILNIFNYIYLEYFQQQIEQRIMKKWTNWSRVWTYSDQEIHINLLQLIIKWQIVLSKINWQT